MKTQERRGFEDDRGTDHPARSHEKRTKARDHAIRHGELGGPFSGTIEDQQLVFDEYGFGHHGAHAARTRQSGDGRQQMENKDGEIAHRTIVSRSRNPKKRCEFSDSPRTGGHRGSR